ncbi:Putative auto-transporter adhesin, head GIN domain [Lutibacter oricola]|uniref:Putative auto-transporter adhesin, head GIN domain n=1 Tax=Lutibacter oricola TaxID=762486 RepID=A0A1H2YU31_9FLAO|nr:DUF2807 domain-containing protein [Lutibacter oricola]SDX08557.1 Putative auto-transporter adhesin, head GIN domain [Lutibacter oricola]
MKNSYLIALFFTIFVIGTSFSQDKLKGNREITTEEREIAEFDKIEVIDNVEVELLYNENQDLKVKADSNLLNAIITEVNDGILTIKTSTKITRKKELKIIIQVNNYLTEINAYNNAKIKTTNVLNIDSLTVNAFDNADFSLKLNAKIVTVNAKKNSDLNLEILTNDLFVNTIQNSAIKGNVNSQNTFISLTEKSDISFKGNSENLELKAIGNGHFIGKEFSIKNAIVNTENNADAFINASETIDISTINTSEVYIYSNPKITITNFLDKASIHKREL